MHAKKSTEDHLTENHLTENHLCSRLFSFTSIHIDRPIIDASDEKVRKMFLLILKINGNKIN